jgi:hypothetical protein
MATRADFLSTRLQLFAGQVTHAQNAILQYYRQTNLLRPWDW